MANNIMTKMLTPNKTSLNSRDLNTLIKDNLKKFIDHFDLKLYSDNKKYSGCCPIHFNSDNDTALLFYKNTGIWMCTTHHCEQTFGRNAMGFIKALISSKNNGWTGEPEKICSDAEVKNLINEILNDNIEKFVPQKVDKNIYNKLNFIRQVKLLKPKRALNDRENFRSNAIVPSQYYLDRGFSAAILDKYDVGILTKTNHQFSQRTVVPIYDNHYQNIIAYTARSLYEKCLVCGYYHDFNKLCPNKVDNNGNSKWHHSYGFIKEAHLYNYWFAKDNIKDKSLIIVEGPSHCWRLSEANFLNSVAYMGSGISDYQINLIKRLPVNTIIIPSDNDEAGLNIRKQIRTLLGKQYKYRNIDLAVNDIAELSIEEVKSVLS